MLKRKIDSYLEQFYKRTNKALLVTGARQTGKSFSIRQYGKTHFENFEGYLYLPIYMSTYLKKETIGDIIYNIDLKGLNK